MRGRSQGGEAGLLRVELGCHGCICWRKTNCGIRELRADETRLGASTHLHLARVFFGDDAPDVGVDPIEDLCGELCIHIYKPDHTYDRQLVGGCYRADVVEVYSIP